MAIFLDIENKINASVEACVAQKKSGIGGFFRNRRNQEAKCEVVAREQHASEINQAEQREREEEDLIYNNVSDTLTNNKTLIITGVVITIIILALLPTKS